MIRRTETLIPKLIPKLNFPKPNSRQWAWIGALVLFWIGLRFNESWISQFPQQWQWTIDKPLDAAIRAVIGVVQPLFRAFSSLLEFPLEGLRFALTQLPWSAVASFFIVLAFLSGGRRLALFTGLALLYTVAAGYWEKGMNTLALVAIAVPAACLIGLMVGVLLHRRYRLRKPGFVALDIMQTMPTFSYLIPILLLFGFGPVVGVIAAIIFAMPPMIRNTVLGLDSVSPSVVEAARMCGASPRQLLYRVKLPIAKQQILLGVNQAIMAGLAMVIIASIIGGFNDIGWEVLSQMRKARFGESVLAGMVIALLAMTMDRVSVGFVNRDRSFARRDWLLLGGLPLGLGMLALVVPALFSYPEPWLIEPAERINQSLLGFVREYGLALDSIKKIAFLFFILPSRIGLSGTIAPYTFGIEFTPFLQTLYWSTLALVAAGALWWRGWAVCLVVLACGTWLFSGVTQAPWSAFLLFVALAAFSAAGWRGLALAIGVGAYILLCGLWERAMLSIYLTGLAVLICFVVGMGVAMLASQRDRVSSMIRPVNDTLQTMPQFVFLIPVLMLFQVGEFSALVAIVAYAIVPIIRYAEHGIRACDPTLIEAARMMGCRRRQILHKVMLPLAIPQILLGVNQTVLFALSMLVIAALVGTAGLGQQIYIALSKANAGLGFLAGMSIALIAITADRILQGFAARRRKAFGL